ncbi:helix-turn-helix transcriptional regulator [Kribbella sp. NPDC003505]|uniref:helix-turn-helix transcriptional regulator n=1 Tax=Kribbella sp. NPDC003505 TaxID=3154448 RepID=UPI0033B7CA61
MTNTAIAPREGASALIAREVRAELGRQQMSNRRLAAALGVSFMWVNRRISTGETDLTVDDTERIAAVLGVPLRQLLDPWLNYAGSPTRPFTGA